VAPFDETVEMALDVYCWKMRFMKSWRKISEEKDYLP
jgi:hypothetical protein